MFAFTSINFAGKPSVVAWLTLAIRSWRGVASRLDSEKGDSLGESANDTLIQDAICSTGLDACSAS